jgi:hypothetical protein
MNAAPLTPEQVYRNYLDTLATAAQMPEHMQANLRVAIECMEEAMLSNNNPFYTKSGE